MGGASTRAQSTNHGLAIGIALWALTTFLASSGAQAAITPRSLDNSSPSASPAPVQPAERLYTAGVQAYQAGDMKNAIRWWQQAGIEGHLLSQYNLGSAYASGTGVPVDMTEAAHWWRLAALQGSTDAQYNLGMIYYEGKGIARNIAEASMWWYMAASGGDAAAQFRLGYMAVNGDNGEVSVADAEWWWQRAADQGYKPAGQALNLLRAGKLVPHARNR